MQNQNPVSSSASNDLLALYYTFPKGANRLYFTFGEPLKLQVILVLEKTSAKARDIFPGMYANISQSPFPVNDKLPKSGYEFITFHNVSPETQKLSAHYSFHPNIIEQDNKISICIPHDLGMQPCIVID